MSDRAGGQKTRTKSKQSIRLAGSTKIVTEFFEYSVNRFVPPSLPSSRPLIEPPNPFKQYLVPTGYLPPGRLSNDQEVWSYAPQNFRRESRAIHCYRLIPSEECVIPGTAHFWTRRQELMASRNSVDRVGEHLTFGDGYHLKGDAGNVGEMAVRHSCGRSCCSCSWGNREGERWVSHKADARWERLRIKLTEMKLGRKERQRRRVDLRRQMSRFTRRFRTSSDRSRRVLLSCLQSRRSVSRLLSWFSSWRGTY